jgi:hypothetical protein
MKNYEMLRNLLQITYLGERIQMIHVMHVAPQISQVRWDIKLHKVLS